MCVCVDVCVCLAVSLVYLVCVCMCRSLVYVRCVCVPLVYLGGVCVHVHALVYVVCVCCVFCVVYVERCGVWLGFEAGTGVNGPSISRTLVYLGSVGGYLFPVVYVEGCVWCGV